MEQEEKDDNGSPNDIENGKFVELTGAEINESEINCVGETIATVSAPISADVSLPSDVLEHLYQRYSIKQRRAGLECFLATSVLFDIWTICVPQEPVEWALGVHHSPERIWMYTVTGIMCIFLVLNISLAIFLRVCGSNQYRGAIWEIAPHLAWLFAIAPLVLQLCAKETVTPRDSLGWAIVFNFLVYVTLPVPLRFAGIVLGIASFTAYILTIIATSTRSIYFWQQHLANSLLLITAAVVGLLCYFLGETKHRRAFHEAKKSLEVKMVIEEQSAEQERLLLSVLPEHVAVKMRQDLGSNDSEQFKKIYMSRHENVSILYADIVGFTAISSTYSAQDLVKMLNELFARFDRLAEKYHQLRIKILGDCYYCISGAIERPDHAVLCVHMGLSMVKAIKYVQQKTNSPVDMRVGIHTGAVLAGILGQRQWQYDVYSKDVELANKMESSGMAGRVHISEKTLNCLHGEFEVEPAYGERREETLRIAGLKTYFIKKVIKPFVPDNELNNGESNKGTTPIEADGPSETFKDEESKVNTPDDEVDRASKEEIYKNRLRKELVSRDGHGELSKDTTLFLRFKNKDLEENYVKHREPLASIPLVASVLVHFIAAVYSSIILPSSFLHFIIILLPISLVILIALISIAESFPKIFPEKISNLSKSFNDVNLLRRLAAILAIFIVGLSNLFDMFMCSTITHQINVNFTDSNKILRNATQHGILLSSSTIINNLLNNTQLTLTTDANQLYSSTVCTYFPSYFSNYAILILIATSLVAQLSHLCKFCLMLVIAGLHCYVNIFRLENQFKYEEIQYLNDTNYTLRYSLSALLILVSIALGLLSRHMDKEDRVIFKWKTEVAEQKEKASDMRHRNEQLVYNILPVHVAEYFIKNKTRSYDELYSQSYDEVGVLFASMPNFSDFYSEDTVNNQGLECLRFLNEVISDFDALLGVPQFHDVIKIKTIGSTYMAASGLNMKRETKPNDSITERWKHLATLVDFALELKKALQCINEQSFNHFVLKMGINHGPITAGVIGARKPHYDIWGNTVNVASRMESTGKAGAIQVTHETCEILQTFGYTFEQRGLVAVKGKGQLMTYYLSGRKSNPASPASQSKPGIVTIPLSPKASIRSVSRNASPAKNDTTASQSMGKSATPLTSCSNSPSSVRINQSYDPNKSDNQTPKSPQTSDLGNKLCNTDVTEVVVSDLSESQDTSNRDVDLDSSEDADRKPLLEKCDASPILVNNNNKHGRSNNDPNAIKNGVNSENVTLIDNCN